MKLCIDNSKGQRVIKRFALLPITLRTGLLGQLQMRWLEYVWISQKRACGSYGCAWLDDHFVGD